MKDEPKSSATVFGEMDAWCRGINEVYNQVHNINQVLPRNLVRVDNSYGFVNVFAGNDLLLSLPVWDLEPLPEARERLNFLSDFCWAMHKAFVSESLNMDVNSL